jgi:lauroyl/myristoyl acyltransferase
MLDFCIYLLYRTGTAIASVLPLGFLFRFGNLMGFLSWLVLWKYRRLARRNLEIAFADEKSKRELRQIARRNFQQSAANLLCGPKLGSMSPKELARYVEAENADAVHQELRAGRPVIILLSHIGNWEVTGPLVPHYFHYARVGTVYQRLRNRYLDQDVNRKRARTGAELFDRSEGFHKPIELLRSGGLIGILGDQHAGDHGLWTPFFGRLASTSPLSALLAKRTGAAVIALAVYTTGPARWRLVFTPRIDSPGDSVNSLTLSGNETIEQEIRKAPEDWFWVHNRWKTPEPNFLLTHYRRGIYLGPGKSANDLKPFRILIRGSKGLDDTILSMPAVRAIKEGRPDAHITIAAPEPIAATWKLVPEVNEVISLTGRSLFEAVRLIRQRPPFDVAILFPNSLRAALEAWLVGVPRRIGYPGHHRRWLLNQIIGEPTKDEKKKKKKRKKKRSLIGPPVDRYSQIARELAQ